MKKKCAKCKNSFVKFIEQKSYIAVKRRSSDNTHNHSGIPYYIYGICEDLHYTPHRKTKIIWDSCLRCHVGGITKFKVPSLKKADQIVSVRMEINELREQFAALKNEVQSSHNTSIEESDEKVEETLVFSPVGQLEPPRSPVSPISDTDPVLETEPNESESLFTPIHSPNLEPDNYDFESFDLKAILESDPLPKGDISMGRLVPELAVRDEVPWPTTVNEWKRTMPHATTRLIACIYTLKFLCKRVPMDSIHLLYESVTADDCTFTEQDFAIARNRLEIWKDTGGIILAMNDYAKTISDSHALLEECKMLLG